MFVCQQEICKKLYQSLDKIDEDRYDAEAKVLKTDNEVETSLLSALISVLQAVIPYIYFKKKFLGEKYQPFVCCIFIIILN